MARRGAIHALARGPQWPVPDRGNFEMITITGKLIQVGNITTYDACGRGLELEVQGEVVTLLGLTIEQCQELAPLVCEQITLTVTSTAEPK